ncbi:TIGR01620 family protein [Paralimibaculum aggregatum]|uniref:TIGR01620 family protein n=1 Tax=Paralimibaculum aggregatum TaxID=3036245 RepID=A0ABQ6LJ62_9RHOB|nr:TIGR01620 family protein [Limibaculum sp. NKW23]GMG83022.1 TIGR01620 family protein [Limibaculum sp. NKW23]
MASDRPGRNGRPTGPRRPVILEIDEAGPEPAPGPAEAPPVPDEPYPDTEEAAAGPPAAERALRRAARSSRTSWIGRLFWTGIGGLVALGLTLWLTEFVARLFERAAWLGWLGAALLAAAAIALLAVLLREAAALARLGRVEGLQRLAASALASEAPGPGLRLLEGLAGLYRARPELGAAETLARGRGIAEGPDIVAFAERRLMPGLDTAAEGAVSRAAGRVATLTALLPMPALDLLLVLLVNIRMIRRIAEIYGGRAGWLGSWRLLKAVAAHVVATGAISATDDLLGPLVGGGLLGQLSRRFGEATVNAALTARVGTAAIEVCRPLPFRARPAPKARNLVLGALKGWRGNGR